MATRSNQEVRLGADWVIEFRCHRHDKTPMDLTDGDLQVRFRDSAGHEIEAKIGTGVTIINAVGGIARAAVPPPAQAGIVAGPGRYEARVVLADGSMRHVAYGDLKITPSLFQ